jgi:hypothetical protein
VRHRPTNLQMGSIVTSLVARSWRGWCTQHLLRIRGSVVNQAWIRRESGAYVTQMLRAKFVYDVRHVARVHLANVARHKGCYIWTPLYQCSVWVLHNQAFPGLELVTWIREEFVTFTLVSFSHFQIHVEIRVKKVNFNETFFKSLSFSSVTCSGGKGSRHNVRDCCGVFGRGIDSGITIRHVSS